MTFSISKRDLLYGSVIAILVIALSTSFLVYKADAEESNTIIKNSEQQSEESLSGLPGSNVSQDIPHLNCEAELQYNAPVSDVYNGEVPYNLDFYRGSFFSGFQDINGDNLPDYIMTNNNTGGSGNGIVSSYIACLYLNNGSGWDEVYKCKATTHTDEKGNAVTKEYMGDCAGTPSAGDGSKG